MFSPSNSGTLRKVGDVVTLNRDPGHDAIGVQVHGDADGAELIFEGAVGAGQVALPFDAGSGVMPLAPDGRFAYLVKAAGVNRFQVRLAAIGRGSVNVAIYSGAGETMQNNAGPVPAPGKVPTVKLTRVAAPVNAGPGPFRNYESAGKFYAIDESCGRSSEAFKNKNDRDKWVAAQIALAAKAAPRPVSGAPAAGPYRLEESNGQFFAVNPAGQSSQAFANELERDQWIAAQPK